MAKNRTQRNKNQPDYDEDEIYSDETIIKPIKKKNKKTRKEKRKHRKSKKQQIKNTKNTKQVKPIVMTTIQNIEDDPKDTYVGKLYADWCVHCKHMKNDWQMMQEALQEEANNGIRVPIILNIESNYEDGFKQKNPSFEASGYPTIFKKKPNMDFEYYGGARSSKDFIKWAKK